MCISYGILSGNAGVLMTVVCSFADQCSHLEFTALSQCNAPSLQGEPKLRHVNMPLQPVLYRVGAEPKFIHNLQIFKSNFMVCENMVNQIYIW